jgi:hypothetical protein
VAATAGGTEVRSVALSGGPVDRRSEPGTWKLSAWPWLVDGPTGEGGATVLRNLATGHDVPVARTPKSTTACSPLWCRVAAITRDGTTHLQVMRPDGSDRREIGGSAAQTVIVDVAPLDRFDVVGEIDPNADLSGGERLDVVELATHRTVEVSPAAANIAYRDGVLSWSTGPTGALILHSLDLRTV